MGETATQDCNPSARLTTDSHSNTPTLIERGRGAYSIRLPRGQKRVWSGRGAKSTETRSCHVSSTSAVLAVLQAAATAAAASRRPRAKVSILLKSNGGCGRPASGGPVQNPDASCPRRPPRPRQLLRGSRPGPRAPRARPRASAAHNGSPGCPTHARFALRPLRTAPARRARPRRQTDSPRRRYLRVLHQIFGRRRSTPCRGAAAAATKRRRNR